jgi:hypothetical protein
MDYQLVIQFARDTPLTFDKVVEVEDRLMEALGDAGEVDGHDIGSGEANIFVLTAQPEAAFLRAKTTLQDMGLINQVSAAYRFVASDTFTRIWPADSHSPFVVV